MIRCRAPGKSAVPLRPMNLGLHGYGDEEDEEDEEDEDPGEYQEYEYEPVALLVTAYRRNARCRRRPVRCQPGERVRPLAVARAWARAVARACALAVAWAWARAVALAVLWAVARAVAAAFRDARDRVVIGQIVLRSGCSRSSACATSSPALFSPLLPVPGMLWTVVLVEPRVEGLRAREQDRRPDR